MAIIVRHVRTGNEYLLLSAGWGIEKAGSPPRFLRNFISEEESAASQWATLCDRVGCIFCLPASELLVIDIDGKKPSELLPEPEILETSDFEAEAVVGENFNDLEEDEDEDWI